MYINKNYPAMQEVINKLRTVSQYDYKHIDDFLDNHLDEELNDKLAYEIQYADSDVLREFFEKLPWSN